MKRCQFSSVFFAFLISLLVLVPFASEQNVWGQLKEIENRIPKNVPLKVEFKNYDSENWVHDLDIIVTNTGNKPIYFLFLSLTLDVKSENGNVRGFGLPFGNGELHSTETEAKPGDLSIAPNASYTFKIHNNSADGWDLRKATGNFIEPTKGFLALGFINYGDGTGQRGGGSHFKKKTKSAFEN